MYELRFKFIGSLLLSLAFLSNVPQGEAASSEIGDRSEPFDEELVVTGKQPGPGLWKLTSDGNELWILGVLSPLPKNLEWDYASIESILSETQEFIYPPGINIRANPLKSLFIWPLLMGIRNNPGKKTLTDVLPEALYQRWLSVKERHIGKNNKVEKFRPIFAADALFEKAIANAGLTSEGVVWNTLDSLIEKYDIKTTDVSISKKVKHVRRSVKNFKRASIPDIECFEKTLNRVESDLAFMAKRAEAWAVGDIEFIRAHPYEDQNNICTTLFFESSIATDVGLTETAEDIKKRWLDAALNALRTNRVSFAVLPFDTLIDSDSVVTDLKAMGIGVHKPFSSEQ